MHRWMRKISVVLLSMALMAQCLMLQVKVVKADSYASDLTYEAVNGTWEVSDLGYVGEGSGDNFALSNVKSSDFIYEADITFASKKGAGSLVFRASSAPGSNSYVANVDLSNNVWKVFGFGSGMSEHKGALSEEQKNKLTFHLKVVVVDHTISYYLDGELKDTIIDTSYESGYLGLCTWNSKVTYNNIKYTPLVSGLNNLEIVGAEDILSYSENEKNYVAEVPYALENISLSLDSEKDVNVKVEVDGNEIFVQNGKSEEISLDTSYKTITFTITNAEGYVFTKTLQVKRNALLLGDVDGNEKVEEADIALMRDSIFERISLEAWQKEAGDLDFDNEITVSDILKVKMILAENENLTKLSYVDVVHGLTDLKALANTVNENEKSWESSAYDKASEYNEGTQTYEDWFANSDWGYDSPDNGDGGIIAAEMEGPGVITRIWSAAPSSGHIKIIIDDETVIDMPFNKLFGSGSYPFNLSSLCYYAGRGANCYVPITYNESCKVVLYEGWGQYFQINYLTYGENVEVESFAFPITSKEKAALEEENTALASDLSTLSETDNVITSTVEVKAHESVDVLNVVDSGAITSMKIKINDLEQNIGEDGVAQDWEALANMAIAMTWDQEEKASVWSTLGGFFASQTGLNEYSSIASGVLEDGTLYSNWYMPYEKGAKVTLTNDGDEDYSITYTITQEDLSQEEASTLMRFHAKWVQVQDPTKEGNDRWPDSIFLDVEGSGRYVGTSLHVYKPIGYADGLGNGMTSTNPVNGKTEAIYPSNWWWGEGDEKFYVDNEAFPSWYGTGAEDYFGYAWGTWATFTKAYHAQPFTNGGMWGIGNRLNNRFHVLDQVPFEESFVATLEKYHRDEYATWAFTSYFYLDHNSDYNDAYGAVSLEERTAYYEDPYPTALVFDENGETIVEGEDLKIIDSSGMLQAKEQNMSSYNGTWSGNEQLVFIGNGTNQSVRFYINIAEEGDYDISAVFTKAKDFGIYQHYIDGEALGGKVDLYCNDLWSNYVTKTSEMYLGYVHLTKGLHVLEARSVGKNTKSSGYVYGMDTLKVSKASTTHIYEGEDQYITSGTANYGLQNLGGWSNGRHLLQKDNTVEDYVSFNIYVNKAGYYDISGVFTKANDFGIVQHYLDNEKIGSTMDFYNGSLTRTSETKLANVYLEKGTHTFKAVVTGKNASSKGYLYGLDYLKVSEVEASDLNTYVFEGENLTVKETSGDNTLIQTLSWTANYKDVTQYLLLANEENDFVTFTFDVPEAGYYKLSAMLTRANDFGYAQHYIDDQKIGNPINNYEGSLKVTPGVIGTVYLTEGTHTLKAVMVKSDSSKNPGYLYGLDKITLQEVIPTNTSTSWTLEGEEMNVISYPEKIVPYNQNLFWIDASAWSQQTHLLTKFNADGQSVSFSFEVEEAGVYAISTAIGKASDFGKVQYAIDGVNLGEVVDGYNTSLSHSGILPLGSMTLSEGEHTLSVTCVGTSGSGRLFGLDIMHFEKE